MADKDYTALVLEEIRDQNKAVLEFVGELPSIQRDIAELREDVAELTSDMKVVKAALADMTHQLDDHERRITRLEAA